MTIDELMTDIRKTFPSMDIQAVIHYSVAGGKNYRVLVSTMKQSFHLFGCLEEVQQQWQTTKVTFKIES